MKTRSIYINRDACKAEEENERNVFIRGVIEKIGVPIDEVWPEPQLTVEQKVRLRDFLKQLSIEIVDDSDRGYKVYHENDLLAQWFKPQFILRQDLTARTADKKYYYEMIVKTETVYDGEDDDE